MVTPDSATVAALLTPLAPGAIAVIALTGPKAREILSTVLRAPRSDAPIELELGRSRLCRIVDGHEALDDAIVAILPHGPHEVAELCTHGGVRIAQRVLALLAAKGAQLIDAESFTARTSTQLSPIELDIDRALLRSRSRRLTQWLLAQRRILPAFIERLNDLSDRDRMAYRHRTFTAMRIFDGLQVAIVGPPNAGKSTLANRLIGHERTITSDTPGTTRDWVSETALIQGWPVTLTDTAGIRETDCQIESEAIRRGRHQASAADLVLILADAMHGEEACKRSILEAAESLPSEVRRLFVFNKWDRAQTLKPTNGSTAILVSATTGLGIEALEQRIAETLGLDQLKDDIPTGFTGSHFRA
ncbi:MAG: GTP-binding protein [Planctomycetia bacterium]|jgi:tRNA modification GTPase|nr:GTP-binding protein [Planctomycetia bacterium]MCC7313224.1 GTP-binding protein [Planctomycetota bacterium]OQZ07172.1 MAG: hypothetical protein B6D36_01195 [Planctomycetes bacterium UTPLA1]